MTLQQLEYIIALAEHANFTKAADVCGVKQPTLSTMIHRLEEELGVTLFDRLKRPVETTDIGEEIVAQARVVLGEAGKITDMVQEEFHAMSGTLSIALLPTIAPFLLPLLLPSLQGAFKGVSLEIKELKTSICLEALLQRELDLAIIASEPENPLLRSRPLFYEEFLGYVSRNIKSFDKPLLHSSDVMPEDLWLLDEGHCFRDQLVRFCKLKEQSQQNISYGEGSIFGFMHMVEAGHGLTFIPQLAKRYLSSEQLKLVRPFAMPRPVRGIYLVWHKDFVRHTILNRVEETVKQSVPQEMLELELGQLLAR